MTEPELSTTSPERAGAPAQDAVAQPLEGQVRSLQLLLIATLMSLFVFGLGLDVYLGYQVAVVRKDLKATYAFLEDYRRNREPLLKGLILGLQSLGPNHAEVAQLLEKYGIKPSGINAPTGAPPASAPGPAPVNSHK